MPHDFKNSLHYLLVVVLLVFLLYNPVEVYKHGDIMLLQFFTFSLGLYSFFFLL